MPIAHKNDVPQEFLNQMKNNLKKEPDNQTVTSTAPSAAKQSVMSATPERDDTAEAKTASDVIRADNVNNQRPAVQPEEKKEKYADVMNIRLSKGRRNEIKTFCSGCGISVTQYIESSFEFLSKEVAAGRIVISKGGITRVE